jgi:hypothetical protein
MRYYNLGDKVAYTGREKKLRGGTYKIIGLYEQGYALPCTYDLQRNDGVLFRNVSHYDVTRIISGPETAKDPLKSIKDEPRVAKDGESIDYHIGHEIVTAQAGSIVYKYCRTCKVEVNPNIRIGTHTINTPIGSGEFSLEDDHDFSIHDNKIIDDYGNQIEIPLRIPESKLCKTTVTRDPNEDDNLPNFWD